MSQQGLNEVLLNRLDEKIKRSQSTGIKALQQAISEGQALNDFIAPIGHLNTIPALSFNSNGKMRVTFSNEPEKAYTISKFANTQLAEKLSVPTSYANQLSVEGDEQRLLLSEIYNKHASWTKRSRMLVRSVDKNVRAFLSDKYKRLDSGVILTSFYETITKKGAIICDGYIDETKVWVETILPTPVSLETPRNGLVTVVFGARLSTSDYGDGKLELRSFMLNGACMNGMVRESLLEQKHLGQRMANDLILSDRTYRLETQAAASGIRDFSSHVLTTEYIYNKMEDIYEASSKEIDVEKEIISLQKTSKITKDESAGIMSIMVKGSPEDGIQGENSVWKLQQGITAFARDIDARRSRELAELAGSLNLKYKTK